MSSQANIHTDLEAAVEASAETLLQASHAIHDNPELASRALMPP